MLQRRTRCGRLNHCTFAETGHDDGGPSPVTSASGTPMVAGVVAVLNGSTALVITAETVAVNKEAASVVCVVEMVVATVVKFAAAAVQVAVVV